MLLIYGGAFGKVGLFYAFYGTNFGAYSATRAFFVIYDGKIVFNLYRIRGTVYLAFFTSDTTVFAFLANDGAFFFIGADDGCFRSYGNKGNYMLGTRFYTQPTAYTEAWVYTCDSVIDADGVYGTDYGAVSVSEASIYTGFLSSVGESRRFAALYSLIFGFFDNRIKFAVAVNKSSFLLYIFKFNSENFRDFFRNSVGSRHT